MTDWFRFRGVLRKVQWLLFLETELSLKGVNMLPDLRLTSGEGGGQGLAAL
jgi:hypothetical protein